MQPLLEADLGFALGREVQGHPIVAPKTKGTKTCLPLLMSTALSLLRSARSPNIKSNSSLCC
eukprot:7955832-Alexandrium_andersonii.AAC.1